VYNSIRSPSSSLGAFYSAGPVFGLGGPVQAPAQAKITIGQPNDPFEREADTVAERVTTGQQVPPISPISSGGLSSIAQRQMDDEEEPLEKAPVQTRLIQRQEMEEEEEPEEEPIQSKFVQRQEMAEEEEPEETPVQPLLIQRQGMEEEEEPEEEPVQPKFVQRQEMGKEEKPEEEPVQSKFVQRQEMEEEEPEETSVQPLLIQRQEIEEEEPEEEPIQPQLIQRCECMDKKGGPGQTQPVQRQVKEPVMEEEPEEPTVQANQAPMNSTPGLSSMVGVASHAIGHRGPGEPLNSSSQRMLESHLGVDLSPVRVHSDGASRGAARTLKARAFTHGTDIWLGAGESKNDLRLMAHEVTHVVQQGSGPSSLQTIQRKPSDYQHPEDGGGVRSRLQQQFDEELEDSEGGVALETEGAEPGAEQGAGVPTAERSRSDADAQRTSHEIDREELREKRGELEGETKPDVDRPAMEQPKVEQSAEVVEQEAESPAEPLVEAEEPAEPEAEEKGEGKEAETAAEQAAGLAEQAFAAAEAQPEPPSQMEVVPPEPVAPVDSAGMSLEGDPATDMQIADLAGRAQLLREQAGVLRAQATEERGNAQILRGNLERVKGEIGKADEGIAKSMEHAQFRHELMGQAEEALTVSEEKAATVAEQAPEYSSKADEGKEDTGPMSSEASELAAENSANTPDDPEAAAKSREQGSKINQVGSDAVTMDSAVSQTKEKASTLAQDAAHATELNTQSREKMTEGQEKLGQVDERLTQMQEETTQARSQVESMEQNPNVVSARAEQLDQQAQALVTASLEIERRLHTAQRSYEEGMKSVPALEPWEGEGSEEVALQMQPVEGGGGMPAEEELVETGAEIPLTPEEEVAEVGTEAPLAPAEAGTEAPLAPEEGMAEAIPEAPSPVGEGRYEERERIDLAEKLPPWLTGIDPQSEEQREQARLEEEGRRQREVEQIDEWAGGRFEDLDAADKVGIALRLVGQNYYNTIANIKWPGWGGLAKTLLDPRSTLTGVVSGLSMMLSGAAGLFSAEQWSKDPLGNLLKSAADIATGLTIVLGSITALAGLVAAVMGALILITFGAASPIAVPVISVCTTIITTVGGWTIAVGKVALILQALTLIKNLIDAATARTAEDLQNQADQIRSDINGAATVVMTIAGAKGSQAGIRNLNRRISGLQARVAQAGGAGALARQTVRALPGRTAAGVRAVGRGIGRGARAVGRGARAVGRGIGRGARAVGRGIRGGVRAVGRGVRGLKDRLRRRLGRAKANQTAVVGQSRSLRLGRETHTFSIRRIGDRIAVWFCSDGCGEFIGRLDKLLEQMPKSGAARRRVMALRRQVRNLDRQIKKGRLTPEQAQAELNKLSRRMESLTDRYPKDFAPVVKPRPRRPRRRLSFRGNNPDKTMAENLKGKGQLAGLERNPNIQGISPKEILESTPRQLAQMVRDKKITRKVFNAIMKTGEGRPLRHGK
jgi:hypothetical protein